MLLPDPRPTGLPNLQYKGFFCWKGEYVVLLIFLRTWALLAHKFLAYIGNWKWATPRTNPVKQDWWVNIMLGCSTEMGRNIHFQMGLFNVMISMFLWYHCSFWCYVIVIPFEQGIVGSSVHMGESPFYWQWLLGPKHKISLQTQQHFSILRRM